MRMYLSSYLWGNHPELLFQLVDTNLKKVAIITNSADQYPDDGIVERLEQDRQYLQSIGYESERLDLRHYFDTDASELATFLQDFGLVWVRGANVFVLRRAMKKSGFDKLIVSLLAQDAIVYAGYSAGACVMGTTLHGLDLVDDAYVIPGGYDTAVIWDGLGLLPYAIAPHYKSKHPESALIDKAVAYYQEQSITFKTLHDGEAIVVIGDDETIVG